MLSLQSLYSRKSILSAMLRARSSLSLVAASVFVLLNGCALNELGDSPADDDGGTGDVSELQQAATSADCTTEISGPEAGVYGEGVHLVASAHCNTGSAEVEWYHRGDCAYFVVQPYSTSLTLDYPSERMGTNQFYAFARVQGTTQRPGKSNYLPVKIVDNTPQCTSVKMVTPFHTQTLPAGQPQTLTATATCPAGAVAEYQFWVKPGSTSQWTFLPAYTTDSASWTPPSSGTWNIKAVVRTIGSHVQYQVGSAAVVINAVP